MLVAAAATVAWGWFEAGWVRKRVVEVALPGAPPVLDGLRIAHLSDLHLGVPGRGRKAVADAVEWVGERKPDLVCITGDLVSRRSGVAELERLLARLGRCYVVLGNHDFADSRDPFSQRIDGDALDGVPGVTLLTDESITIEARGRRVQIVGVDPRTYARRDARPHELIDESIELRILLCHFPGIVRRIPPVFQLVLSGHLHAGQIVVPYPGGKLRLAHLRARDVEGVYDHGTTKLHVSPGLGTTFVPFRLFARPEVTELVIRARDPRRRRVVRSGSHIAKLVRFAERNASVVLLRYGHALAAQTPLPGGTSTSSATRGTMALGVLRQWASVPAEGDRALSVNLLVGLGDMRVDET